MIFKMMCKEAFTTDWFDRTEKPGSSYRLCVVHVSIHMGVYMCVCVCVCVCVCACMCACMCACLHLHAFVKQTCFHKTKKI